MTDGRRLRILAVVDDYTRECLALLADTSISGIRVARELDKIVATRGRPGGIVSDNGTELTSSLAASCLSRGHSFDPMRKTNQRPKRASGLSK